MSPSSPNAAQGLAMFQTFAYSCPSIRQGKHFFSVVVFCIGSLVCFAGQHI